jgi:hypothetical protein
MNDGFLYKPGMYEREKFVTKVMNATMRTALKEGYDVILDNTNLAGKTRKDIHKFAESWGDITVIEKVFNVPLKKVLAQNAQRTGEARVPDDVIENFAKKYMIDKQGYFKHLKDRTIYYPPTGAMNAQGGVEQDPSLPKAIVCDLDGTLALLNGRNPYDASTCDQDSPNVPVVNTVRAFHEKGYKILFVSGRSDEFKPQTEKFLNEHVPDLAPHTLIMRKKGDQRKDSLIKREIYDDNIKDKFFVEFVIDDRPQVVRMWRWDLGFTVFQLDDTEF